MPTFSPRLCQLLGACEERLGLCEMVPAAAMWSDQRWATDVSVLSTRSATRPCWARTWLVREMNWEASVAALAPADGASAANVVELTRRLSKSPQILRIWFLSVARPPWGARPGRSVALRRPGFPGVAFVEVRLSYRSPAAGL